MWPVVFIVGVGAMEPRIQYAQTAEPEVPELFAVAAISSAVT